MVKKGVLIPQYKFPNGFRYYKMEQISKIINPTLNVEGKIIDYCRASSNKQKDDLERQVENMKTDLLAKWKPFSIIQDIGSGINYNKKGLQQLIKEITTGKIEKVVVMYKDRLLRFELVEQIASIYNCSIEVVDNTEKTEDQKLVEDLVQIITFFSCKLHGKRANKTKKMVDELLKENE